MYEKYHAVIVMLIISFALLATTFAGILARHAQHDTKLSISCSQAFHEFYQNPETNIMDDNTVAYFNRCVDIMNTLKAKYSN